MSEDFHACEAKDALAIATSLSRSVSSYNAVEAKSKVFRVFSYHQLNVQPYSSMGRRFIECNRPLFGCDTKAPAVLYDDRAYDVV
jgi:hypothetical protein